MQFLFLEQYSNLAHYINRQDVLITMISIILTLGVGTRIVLESRKLLKPIAILICLGVLGAALCQLGHPRRFFKQSVLRAFFNCFT